MYTLRIERKDLKDFVELIANPKTEAQANLAGELRAQVINQLLSAPLHVVHPVRTHNISEEGRKRISEAQKRRWRAKKGK